MSSSEARIAANRANALKSTGPRTEAGKEIARANALKHGLSSLVVVPGEEQGAVAARVEWLQDSLAPEGDPLTLILARQVAFLSVQAERAFRHETAATAWRARLAEASYDEERRTVADQWFDYLGAEPITNHRRLMSTIEGVDLLIGRLEELGRVGKPGGARWDDHHKSYLDTFLGRTAGTYPVSRGWALSNLFIRDDATGLDPDEVRGADQAARAAWALAEIHQLIAAEVDRLRAHRATLDPARYAVDRREAPERALLGFDKEAQLAQRYQFAATRAMQRAIDQIRTRRRDLTAPTPPPELADAKSEAYAMPNVPPMPVSLASFCETLDHPFAPADASRFTTGTTPITPVVVPHGPPKPPRYTP